MDFIKPDDEPANMAEQAEKDKKSNASIQWDNLPFEKLIEIIGDNLSDREFGNFAEDFHSWIVGALKKVVPEEEEEIEEDDDKLAELINKIIETNPSFYDELKNIIGQIFEKNHQFEIPQ